jgi:hypothetical protein
VTQKPDKPKWKNPASAENGKNGGRPEEWTKERIEAFADKLEAWAKEDSSRYLESFCKLNKTYPQKLYELAEKNSRFSESLKFARSSLSANIAELVEVGATPPAWGIFAMKNVGKWTDKQEVEHSGTVEQVVKYKLPERQ